LRAGFAADAAARVEINDSVFSRKKRRHRTDFNTWRVGAMIAAHHAEKAASIWKFSLFDVFNPSAINTERHLVFRFAGDRAGVTADTLAVINDEAKIHINLLRLRQLNCLRRTADFND
jgi:hypothetical protein